MSDLTESLEPWGNVWGQKPKMMGQGQSVGAVITQAKHCPAEKQLQRKQQIRTNCPHVPPGMFHSMSLLSALSEDAVTLLVKTEQTFTFLKRGSLTHLLLPSLFKELSSSRFYFAESKFRV